MDNQKLSHVFVVDDEPIIAETLATILRHAGFSARSFVNPLEALFAAHSDAPDFLLSDVVMPQLSGVLLAIRITKLRPQCKVLLFSGQAYTVDLLDEARRQGHRFELLSKPARPDDLLRRIRAVQNLPAYRTSVASPSELGN